MDGKETQGGGNSGIRAKIDLFYSSKTWVSPDAITQLSNAATMPGMRRIAAMPDIHPGAGSPGGVAFASHDLIHPKLIGGDIGCGMHLCATSIDARVNVRRLGDSLGSIDDLWEGDRVGYLQSSGADLDKELIGFEKTLGTIGGGNHFAELQVIHQIFDPKAVDELGLSSKKAMLLVHSGSRGMGQEVLNRYHRSERHNALDPESQEGLTYLRHHRCAVEFAKSNRRLIAQRFAEKIGSEMKSLLDLSHNFLEYVDIKGERFWLHRKGAAPADQGLVVIPGSRSSLTYLVRPCGDGAINLKSLAHGAGRKVSRTQSDEKFGKISLDELRRPKDKEIGLDNLVICEQRDLLRQEHGKAYKDIDRVIEDMRAFGLLEVVATFKPILTYKTRSLSDDGEG
ncbi:MAG: hypothetical protein RLY14_160 [Planctomycetota bacterium]